MDVNKIIAEEAKKLFSQSFYDEQVEEGTGDRYAEKRFGIPDEMPQWEKRADQSRYDPSMGEMVGYTYHDFNDVHVPIFKNPTSLTNFEPEVRAVSDANGNLYVAQKNDDFVHGAFNKVMRSDPYNNSVNITWHRVEDSNVFGISDTFTGHAENYKSDVEQRLDLLRKNNPSFRFIPAYYTFIDPTDDEIEKRMEPMEYFEEGVDINEIIREEIVADEVGNYLNDNFWQWFGNSKVVDNNSKPLRVYHGTSKDFDRFKETESQTGHRSAGLGFYFTSGKNVADRFNRDTTNIKPFGDILAEPYREGANIMPLYLSIQNPKHLSAKEFYYLMSNDDWSAMRTPEEYGEIRKQYIVDGYDGIFIGEEGIGEFMHPQFIAFNPEQIKSASGNDGNFSSSADITKEGVGDKYAEKAFGIRDADRQYAAQGVPDADMGEKMTPIWATNYRGEKGHYGFIYKNPKTLRGFDADARAIAFDDGDLYVAQQDGDFIHVDMELSLEKLEGPLGEYYEFHRVGTTNEFGASDTLIHKIQDYALDMRYVIEELEQRHPNFEFSTTYYEYLRNSVNEGVGDKYLQSKGVMPDSGQQFQQQWQQKQKTDTQDVANGEVVGQVELKKGLEIDGVGVVNIYKNPKSLKNFDKDIRAVSDNEGNLYLAQLNGNFLHDDIGDAAGIRDTYDTTKYMTWVRVGETDKFYQSYSFRAMYKLSGEDYSVFQQRMKVLNQKQSFQFMTAGPMYEVVNEVEDNANHTPDEMPFIMEAVKSPQEIADDLRRSEYWDRMAANNPDYYKDEVPILANVDVDLADKAFKEDLDFYIGPNDDGIGNRKERVMQTIEDGSLMYAPDVSIRMAGINQPVLSFGDGRHRFAVLRDLGVETINLTFNKDSEDHIHLLQR